jgi:hypothetical protein
MYCLGSDHVVPQQRHDATAETVFSVWSMLRLYTKIPRITDAVEKRIGTSAVQFRAVNCDRVIEDEIMRLNSDLKCQFVC